MDDQKKLKLPLFIHSHEQVYFYIQELSRYRSDANKEHKDSNDPLHAYLLSLSKTGTITPGLIEDALELFEKVKKNAPRFTITLADYPEEDLRNKIVKWFRENIHEYALLSFRYDRALVGGVVVRGRNKIHDFSFLSKLQDPKLTPVDILENVAKQTV